jgi:hypothetical protein
VSTTVDGLKDWIASGNTKKPFGGIAENLLEAEEEFGFEDLKALVMRVAGGVEPGTEFHVGFAIYTSGQHEIEARANDDAIRSGLGRGERGDPDHRAQRDERPQ